jgi:hypothetical protein
MDKNIASNEQIDDQYIKQQINNLSSGDKFIVTSNVNDISTISPINNNINMGNPINIPTNKIFTYFSVVKPNTTGGYKRSRRRTNRRRRTNKKRTNRRRGTNRRRTNRRY